MWPSLSSNQQPRGQKTQLFELYARKVLVILAYDQLIGQACYITVIVNLEVIIWSVKVMLQTVQWSQLCFL